jgi:uncharacterized repeat protein (TIGR02543 family)
MGILNYLPTFHAVEINRSTGLVMGHVLSQNEAGADLTLVTKSGYDFLENGVIVGLSNDRTIENYDFEKHSQPFLIFSEELNDFMSGLKYFAQEETDEFYPRAVALYPGDAFTTNNYSGVFGLNTAFAKVVNGILTLQNTADDYTLFAVNLSSMPADSSTAVQFIYLGYNQSQIDEIWDELTFVLNGGTWDGSTDDIVVMAIQGHALIDYEPTPDPTYADHVFDGWFLDDGVWLEPILSEPVSADVEIFAKWLELFTITYNGNGGTIDGDATVEIEAPEGELIGSIDFGSTPVFAGYTWISPYWSSTSAVPYVDIASTTVVADDTIYATWEPTEYTITYNLDGGTNDVGNPAVYDITTATITLADATKALHTFGGWFNEATFQPANEVTEIALGSTGDVTLYAKFTLT